LLRTGLLADAMARMGHHVTWWTSNFDHVRKSQRVTESRLVRVNRGLDIRLVSGCGYRRNISARRLIDHALIGVKFALLAAREQCPDVIVCSLPTPELCAAACSYGRRHLVPVVLDVRDLWPDVFADAFPAKSRFIGNAIVWPYRILVQYACKRAAAIIGPTAEYVRWGLAHAGRNARGADRVFPFAYLAASPNPSEIDRANQFWAGHGVSAGDGHFNVCFLGTLGSQFDMETVILAARKLQAVAPSVRFVICGSGDREAHYRDLARGCSNILFPGWVGSAEIWTLMRLSCIGLAPYLPTRNFVHHIPNKPIEYLSAGLPVLTTLSGTLGQLLQDHNCGVVYRTGNSDELASHISQLHRSPSQLRLLAENAAALFRARFQADVVYTELVHYLERLAGCQGEVADNARERVPQGT